MKKLIILLIIFSGVLFAQENANVVKLFTKLANQEVHLKWTSTSYKSSNTYKLYRSEGKSKEKLIAIIKPTPYESLKKGGYSDDYIFMIYPFKDVKSLEDKIKLRKIESGIALFRSLAFAQDNQFAKNIGQSYVDKKLQKNRVYNYRVVLFDSDVKIAQSSASIKIDDKKQGSGIIWVQAKGVVEGVSLTWDLSTKHGFYNIYRKLEGEKEFKKQTETPLYVDSSKTNKKSVYTDVNLKKGQSATYYIRKIDMFTDERVPSAHVKAKRILNLKPKIVSNIFVKNSSSKIALRWEKIPKVLGYNIYRSENSGGGFQKLNKKLIKEEAYFDRKFKENQNYYYYLTAVNMYGESSPSAKTLAYAQDVVPPSFPKNLTAEVGTGKVTLKWTKLGEKDLLGYKVYMSMDKEKSEWALVTKEPITKNIFIHNRPKELSRNFYYYRVTGIDKSLNESATSNIVKIKLPDVTSPAQPSFTSFNAYATKIVLSWNPVVVYDFSHYNLYKKGAKGFVKLNKEPLTTTNYTDINPKVGFNEYALSAVDLSGNESLKSQLIKVLREDIIGVKVEKLKLKQMKNGVKISFVCNDKDYSGFEVLRSSGGVTKYGNISGFKKGMHYVDKTTHKKKSYFYKIKAYDKSGNVRESDVLEIQLK